MLKTILRSLTICVAFTALASYQKAPEKELKPSFKTIIVDAGHGGKAIGARGKNSTEKAVCLAIALKLGKQLSQIPGVKVVYTRKTDVYVDNRYRAEMANKNKGDLYISIHANSAPPIVTKKKIGTQKEIYYTGKGKNRKKRTRIVPKYRIYSSPNPAHGTETYIWAADRTDAKGEFVAERISSEEYTPDIDSPEFRVKSMLWTKRYFDKSLSLASFVEQEFVKGGRSSRGVKQRNNEGIWILQATAMPSILVETGFISNRNDENYLSSAKGQEAIAKHIYQAVKRYKVAMEAK
ncbi:MAG: N-acetylmuramoyl-L-alanine amidase [Chitinophagaceae bacterium]|nr:N-acetylmuramoyl-L-alanine amidase [Chitinophagaceae bacterium]